MEEQRPQNDRAQAPARTPDSSGDVTQPSPETLGQASRFGFGGVDLADSFPGYTLMREVHRGGQGVVYEAVQHSTRRKVAVKVLKEGPLAGPGDRARFTREIEILAQLQHPNIVTIHDSGAASGHVYFVMDYIAGQSLDQWSAAAPRSLPEALRLFHQVCVAVNAAHQRGIVHRDLKPGNVRVDTEGQPHILDFGLAKMTAAPITGEFEPQAMTLTGQFMGSLPWASPEQAEAIPGRIDTRTDVYALGVILYQMLTGRFPYPVVGNLRDVLSNILQAEPTRPSTFGWHGCGHGIDNEVETIVLKCLQKDRARRYQTAGELARDIERYLTGQPIAARRDSVLYLLRVRTRATLRRQTALVGLTIVVLATLLAHYWPGAPLINRWTPANGVFERLVMMGQKHTPTFVDVRVIALTDKTDLQHVAAAAGIDAGCLKQDPKCLRHAHGQLMEKLAAAGAAAVAWDINFSGESPYDKYFMSGVRALEQAGSAVVVAADTWSITGDPELTLSSLITAVTRWGSTPAGLQADEPWRIYLAVQHGVADPVPSLALRMFAAVRRPGREFSVRLDPQAGRVKLVYWTGFAARGVPSGEIDEIRVSAMRPAERSQSKYGLRSGDMLAYYLLDLPGDDVLAAATLDYGQALAADPPTLRRLVGGCAVLIGDGRGGRAFPTPDRRRLLGTYAHATAVDMLLRDAPVRRLYPELVLAVTAAAALLGLLAGRALRARPWTRTLTLVLAGVAIVLLGFAEARYGRVLYNPLIAVLALVIASESSAHVYAAIGSRRA